MAGVQTVKEAEIRATREAAAAALEQALQDSTDDVIVSRYRARYEARMAFAHLVLWKRRGPSCGRRLARRQAALRAMVGERGLLWVSSACLRLP